MSPVAVTGLDTDAREYMVFGVALIIRSRSAHPKASSQTILPSRATATLMEATPVSLSASRILALSGASSSAPKIPAGTTVAARASAIPSRVRCFMVTNLRDIK